MPTPWLFSCPSRRVQPRRPATRLVPSRALTSKASGGATRLTLSLSLSLGYFLTLTLTLALTLTLTLALSRCDATDPKSRNETCNGRGDCVNDQCKCDLPYLGFNCSESIGCN